ncbi:MAG: TIGR03936 family radical SAM-associated protein [Armatimonadota bacterium]
MFRVLLSLKKDVSIKFISHLDLVKAFEYALRRAKTPVAYSEGFNPRPKMSFGGAVGVGVSSDDERFIIELVEPVNASEIMNNLNANLPPGLQVLSAENVQDGVKSPVGKLNASDFEITVSTSDMPAVKELIGSILQSDEYRVTRAKANESKVVDIRPYVIDIIVIDNADGSAVINASFKSTNSGGGRPQDIIQALCGTIPDIQILDIKRIRQYEASETV